MKPSLKFGLIVGLAAVITIVPVAAAMGICGPVVTLVAGAIAGFLSAYFGDARTRHAGAQSGAMAGAIAGAMALAGQLAGGALALVFLQATEIPVAFGEVPSLSAPIYESVLYYGSGLAVGLCFGILGIGVGAGAGALTGAFGVREPSIPPRLSKADGSAS